MPYISNDLSLDGFCKKQWEILVKRTKTLPLIPGALVYKEREGRWILQESFNNKILCPLFLFFLGGLCFYPIAFDSHALNAWHLLSLIAGSIFIFIAVGRFISVNSVQFDIDNSILHLSYGSIWNSVTIKIPEHLVELSLNTSQGAGRLSRFQKGGVVILLSLKEDGDNPPAVKLAFSDRRDKYDLILCTLSKSLSHVRDFTITSETLPDGQVIRMSKTGVSCHSQQFAAMSSFYTDNQVTFSRSFFLKALWSIVLLFGIGGVYFLIATRGIKEHWLLTLFLLAFLLIACLGALGLFLGFGVVKVVVNKKRGEVLVKKGLLGGGYGLTKCELRAICGIQICSQYVIGDPESGDFTVYELNLVLDREPLADRINLQNDTREDEILSEAGRLAVFLKKPVFNHQKSQEGCGGPCL